MTNQKDIFSYLVPGKCAHLAGIGGVSMSPLAEVLHGMGLKVQGSDMNDGPSVEHLRSLGIPVAIGHAADNLGECDFVIRTAAIHDDNPEISGAVTRGIPVFERAQAWGAIMKGYKNALCISGTHGKTTTTSMATHIFMAAQKDPTVMIGGTLQLLHSGYRVGKGDTIIAESCEYCNSFLSFFPTVAVILNVEADHLDFFKDLADVEHSFRRFEYKGSFHGADVYDDYAHHPGELHALLEMAKTLPYKRIICAFQPHTYTRTKALFNDFVKELRVPDVVVLAEIYAAREQNDIGISSMDLSREIPGSVYCPTLDKVTAALARIACPGDLILTVGAGDIFKAGEKLLKEEK